MDNRRLREELTDFLSEDFVALNDLLGEVRTERDLLESIVFPSASFVRSYEPVLIRTGEGQVYSGNIKKDAPIKDPR